VKAQGVAYSSVASAVYVATTNGVYEIPYHTGDRVASRIVRIANVRTGSVSSLAPPGDSDVHTTTSVTASKTGIFIGVGSSCNACAETDPTRAVVLAANFDGSNLHTVATRIRNPVALAVDPATQDVWVGGAGQDCLPQGLAVCSSMDDAYASDPHPYEYVDNLTLAMSDRKNVHANEADYAWPLCEENHRTYSSFALVPSTTATPMPADYCSTGGTYQAVPLVEFPAYSTHIGMSVSTPAQTGTYALPAPYNDALIVSNHGSWHETSKGIPVQTPSVSYVPLAGRLPATAVDFSHPGTQYQSILFNYQADDGSRVGQPSGIAIGPQGSLFIADDYAGVIYRVRPGQDPNHFDARARSRSPHYHFRH
jgi:glucose/arabinose dehydrogenase